jgi:aminopeptidase YwaD
MYERTEELVAAAARHVAALCGVTPDRHVGSPGNAEAVDMFEQVATSLGWRVESTPFECVEWEYGDSWIDVDGAVTALHAGPYSLACYTTARLAEAWTVEDLEAGDFAGTILLLRGAIAHEQLMPKNFSFYNPQSHKRIYAALEKQQPAAIVAVTERNPDVAGAVYPFPLIEDADFDIPNAFVSDIEGAPLLGAVGREARIHLASVRVPSTGRQLVARKAGSGEGRVVVFAHIDGRKGIPAALDNASGAASLLVLAELLADYDGALTVEIVPLNGEDYYGACGQVIWVRDNAGRFGDIVLGMNADDSGHAGADTGVSLYALPEDTEALVGGLIEQFPGFCEGPQWPQSDHSLFIMNGVPAIAFTAEDFMDTFRNITHTPADRPELVDPAIVVDVARFMAEVIEGLNARA